MMILSNNIGSTMVNNSTNALPQNPTNFNPWTITAQEHQANEGQFIVLRPIAGLIGGEQARPFFLKSGLPAAVLAQIWQLADLNKDGKLDRLEFSIAMKLVRNCLAGLALPQSLPDSMRQISGSVASSPFAGQTNGGSVPSHQGAPVPQMPLRPMSTYGMSAISSGYRPPPYGGSYSAAPTPTMAPNASLPFQMGVKELGDWTLPQPMKLRFCQQFNQLDKSRVGLLTGQQARGVLGESQLPSQILAQIWNMSDVNKDGCLSIEEFCTAQFLIEMVKAGYALPSKLPNELNAFCHRSRTVSPSTTASTPTDPNAPPPQKGAGAAIKTFEDKRRDNLDKGQAELDRRRQILREEEERRRAEIERREREEVERKERERQELERRREAELEVERQKELERERERAAEEERLKAHREEARRKLEQERIKELEKIRIRDLENQLQAETEKTTQIQQRQRTMAFQLQALDERSQQLNTDITGTRDKILEITQEIEGMREQRDEKCGRIQELERKAKELTVQSERLSHENLQLQSESQRQLSRGHEIEALRKEMVEIDEEIIRLDQEAKVQSGRANNQEKLAEEKRPDWEKSCEQFKTLEKEHVTLLEQYNNKRKELHPTIENKAPQYEMPPVATFGSTSERRFSKEYQQKGMESSSGFGTDFNADFAVAFGNNATNELRKERSVDEMQRSESGNVASIAAKLQQQLQFQQPIQRQKQASLSREGSVTSNSGKQNVPENSFMEGLQQQKCTPSANLKTAKYRALYEFSARSGDELSLQPGDIILVFEGHQSEPGWLAGQIRDKVGWFPAAFAEPVTVSTSPTAAASTATVLKKAGSLAGSPSGEPLASIKEEGEVVEKKQQQANAPFVADFSSAFTKSVSMADTSLTAVASAPKTITSSHSAGAFITSTGAALYDLPPGTNQTTKVEEHKQAQNATTVATPLYEMPPGDGSNLAMVLGTGVALYQWKARNEQEMSFARGDIIEVLEKGEMRWRGRLQKNRNTEGWFPKSYIKLDSNNAPMPGIDGATSNGSEQRRVSGEKLVNGKNGVGYEVKEIMNATEMKKSDSIGEEGIPGEWFIALYQFDAVETTDLSLKPGDRIWVTDQKDQWWRGTSEGRTGIFPANYVQKASEMTIPNAISTTNKQIGRAIAAFEATASNQISLRPGDMVHVHQMTPGGWWEGELERDGERQFGWFPGNYIQLLHPMNAEADNGKIMALATFDYQAQQNDELSFKAGDLIEILDRSDTQWWKGRKAGDEQQEGPPLLFPANFVQLQ